MESYLSALSKEEHTTLHLSALYEKSGYKKYRNTRFEEYSFYHDFQGFLAGEGVITFNNADGRLMALKPDMTLSILKNVEISPRSFSRIYYNENVYRFQKSTRAYKEIHQCGLEIIGPLDAVATGEVVLLALQSLSGMDEDYVLTLSHADLVAQALEAQPVPAQTKERMAVCMQKKNLHDLQFFGEQAELAPARIRALQQLADTSAPLDEAADCLLALAADLFDTKEARAPYEHAVHELQVLDFMFRDTEYAAHLLLDTSVINPVDYYSGIVMQGYIRPVPQLVLAGGRYDRLAHKLRKDVGAMGFAVYLDRLSAYYKKSRASEADTLLLYEEDTPPQLLMQKRRELQQKGHRVRVEKEMPANRKAGLCLRYADGNWEECHV